MNTENFGNGPTNESSDEPDEVATAEQPGSNEEEREDSTTEGPSLSFTPSFPVGFAQPLLHNRAAELLRPMQRFAAQAQSQQAAFASVRTFAERIQAQQAAVASQFVGVNRMLDAFRRSVVPYTQTLAELPRRLLPPNLRDVSEHITAIDVQTFLEEEGIPLYLVPRAAIGKRLVHAKCHESRRRVLNDRFTDIVDDCVGLIDACSDPIINAEVHFIQDGVGSLRAGHYASAQAIFTLTLDTLISRFYPNREMRKKITNRKKGAPVPDEISDMNVRAVYVWLPVWNAHQQFWQDKGDRIPSDYSRHATVHGVSRKQFNKRNCVQALMLASSLVGYANQLAQAHRT